ncbi:uncharacterized protein B0I36DRAFT_29356 [Microdochium trichocladiopsis]|uniref:CFEM domain-containing protein n=1 Tax=Microdochium trichocladiopsis TaxID=1682393 RepID=A0A9P8XVW4_9PEZI|nr:uncharacterized protein B0I36DRAFT_29356 [Microdochium trichocladiopsis]KAH7021138.1 hypothetical protein B0I36DRAFT_29356 [Microdochium trichocladiopsis]
MRSSAVLLGAAAGLVAAQAGFPEGFPACGSTCIGNMLGLAGSLGCEATNAQCLCNNQDFAYGIRDCSRQACGDEQVANQVIAYGVQYCANAGVAVIVPGAPGPSGTGPVSTTLEATSPPTNTQGAVGISSTGSGEGVGSSASGPGASSASGGAGSASTPSGTGAVPISTAAVLVTSTNSDGSVVTSTIGSTTIYSEASGGGLGGLVPISTATIVSTGTDSAGSTFVTSATSTIFSSSAGAGSGSQSAPGSGSGSGSASGSVSTIVTSVSTNVPITTTNSQGSPVSTNVPSTVATTRTTTGSPGLAVKQTAAPVGLLAAAGVAVLML